MSNQEALRMLAAGKRVACPRRFAGKVLEALDWYSSCAEVKVSYSRLAAIFDPVKVELTSKGKEWVKQ